MRQPKTSYIYGLKDPRDGQIYYIGKSDHPEQRKREHLRDKKCNARRVEWIDDLQSRGLEPEFIILEETIRSEWREREIYWIAKGNEDKWPLVNIHPGGCGGGNEGYRPSYGYMRSYVHPGWWGVFEKMTIAESDMLCQMVAVEMCQTVEIAAAIDKRKHFVDWDKVNDLVVYVGQRIADDYFATNYGQKTKAHN